MLIKPLFIAALETALNQYLALDEHVGEYLSGLAGKVIALRVDSLNATIYLCPSNERIQILENYPGEVDAELSGSLSALGLMGLSATPMRSLFKGEVRIGGDTQVARKLQRLFEKLDIDLESKLARYAGENLAHKLTGLLRGSQDWSRHSLNSFRLNLEEFLQEETRELPAKAEAELFFQHIDACRTDYDRLLARIERLNAAAPSPIEPKA